MEQLRQDIKNHPSFEAGAIADWEENIDGEINLIYDQIQKDHGEWKKGTYYPKKDEDGQPIDSQNKYRPYYEEDVQHFDFLFKPTSIINFDTLRPRNINKDIKLLLRPYSYDEIKNQLDKSPNTGNDELDYKRKFSELLIIKNFLIGEFIEVTYTVLRPGIEFTIFETLNTRGEDINGYDLTRNLL